MFRHKRWLFAFLPLLALVSAMPYLTPARAAPVDTFLDPDFAVVGQAQTRFSDGMAAYSLALQDDGGILVAGGLRNFALARYTPAGRLDPGFGDQGQVVTDLNGNVPEVAQAIIRQADGRIVLAGYSGSSRNFVLVLYDADGHQDMAFGPGGATFTDFDGLDDEAHALAQQADGKLLRRVGHADLRVPVYAPGPGPGPL